MLLPIQFSDSVLKWDTIKPAVKKIGARIKIQPRLKSNIPMKNLGKSICSILPTSKKLIKR